MKSSPSSSLAGDNFIFYLKITSCALLQVHLQTDILSFAKFTLNKMSKTTSTWCPSCYPGVLLGSDFQLILLRFDIHCRHSWLAFTTSCQRFLGLPLGPFSFLYFCIHTLNITLLHGFRRTPALLTIGRACVSLSANCDGMCPRLKYI